MDTMAKTSREAVLIAVLSISVCVCFVTEVDANSSTIVDRLRESGKVTEAWIDSLEWALNLREENRHAVHSLDVAYTKMDFYSQAEMQRMAMNADIVMPLDGIPNPFVQHVHYAQDGNSVYVRSVAPQQLVPQSRISSSPLVPSEQLYAMVERRQEFVVFGDIQFQKIEDIPLQADVNWAELNVVNFSIEGSLQAPSEKLFGPEKHEFVPLELLISDALASDIAILENLHVGINEQGTQVLDLVIFGERSHENKSVEEWLHVVYSMEESGLLLQAEITQIYESEGEKPTLHRLWLSDVSFAEFDTENGRVVLPVSWLVNDEIDGELQKQNLVMLDEETLRVNEGVPDETFRVTVNDIIPFTQHYHEFPARGGAVYRNVDELPEDIRAITRLAGVPDSFSSAERFPFDEEWTEKLFAAYGGVGGDGGTPFGNIELARYAQNPVPQTYSGVMPFGWLNANTLALAFGLFLIIGGLVLRNLPLRRGKQSVAQSV